jgi:hypothetical protein
LPSFTIFFFSASLIRVFNFKILYCRVPFLSTIQGKKKRRKTITNFTTYNLPSARLNQNPNQKKGDSPSRTRRGSCPNPSQDLASIRLVSPSYLNAQDGKEKPYESILSRTVRAGNTESIPSLISDNTVGEYACDDSVFSLSVQLSKDVNDGIELSQICNVDDSTSDSPCHCDGMHLIESDSKNYSKNQRSERRKFYDNHILHKTPVARKLSYSGGCMYGSASLSMDVSDQLPTLEVDAFSRTLQRRNSQGVLECSESADHLHLIGTVSMTINYLTILNYY